jgi:hypothetical protein
VWWELAKLRRTKLSIRPIQAYKSQEVSDVLEIADGCAVHELGGVIKQPRKVGSKRSVCVDLCADGPVRVVAAEHVQTDRVLLAVQLKRGIVGIARRRRYTNLISKIDNFNRAHLATLIPALHRKARPTEQFSRVECTNQSW